jgi:hypothetical protein
LKARGLISSPALVLLKAADRFEQPTTANNQLISPICRGWFYLSTALDDFSPHILAWMLCTTMT